MEKSFVSLTPPRDRLGWKAWHGWNRTRIVPAPCLLRRSARQFLPQRDQPFGNGQSGQARHAVDAEFAHDALTMGFDGADAEAQVVGNFLVAETLGNQQQDLPLPLGKLRQVGPLLAPWTNWLRASRVISGLKKVPPALTVSIAFTSSSGDVSFTA